MTSLCQTTSRIIARQLLNQQGRSEYIHSRCEFLRRAPEPVEARCGCAGRFVSGEPEYFLAPGAGFAAVCFLFYSAEIPHSRTASFLRPARM